jgi:hypothetical protein
MDPISWALYAFLSVGLLAGALFHYRRNEPAGRGRYVLAALRGAALALILLLLFDPVLPARGTTGRTQTVAVVDASLSMRLRAPDGTTRWEEALRAVESLGPDRVVLFGAGPAQPAPPLEDAVPHQPASQLGPALRSVLEAGPARVVVISDAALEDTDDVTRLAAETGIPLTIHVVGARTAWNAGLTELDAPAWTRADREVEVRVGVARLGEGAPDSLTVRLSWGQEELARAAVATPPEGRAAVTTLRFTPPRGMSGRVRLDAELVDGGAEAADDGQSVYVRVDEEPAGVVLVSFLPDQEPRFLLPVLERALGLPARGWLAVAPGRFLRLGVGRDAGLADAEAEVRRAAAAADLLVFHGVDGGEPGWARQAAGQRPTLLFPRDGAEGVPVQSGPRRPGEWYADAELPASPVTPFLVGVSLQDAPPLTAVRAGEAPAGWWAPLLVRQDRRGEARPVLLAGEVGGRRMAVALADGYWRWAFAEEGGRPLYDALWSGVAGWLAQDAPDRDQGGVRAETSVVRRGQPLRWLGPAAADSMRVTLHPLPAPRAQNGAGAEEEDSERAAAPALDTTVMVSAGVAERAPARPGHYRYEVRAFGGPDGSETAMGTGELTVERYSPEFTRPARSVRWADATQQAVSGESLARAVPAPPGRALRTVAWPWLAVVTLLCAEWVLRRRWGLR